MVCRKAISVFRRHVRLGEISMGIVKQLQINPYTAPVILALAKSQRLAKMWDGFARTIYCEQRHPDDTVTISTEIVGAGPCMFLISIK